jgi:hypothetical protein
MSETALREAIVHFGRSMFERGLTFGSSGNISARLNGGWLMTPTNVALDRLDPARLSKLDADGKLVSGDAPTKESFLHIAMYRERAARRQSCTAFDPFGRGLMPRRCRCRGRAAPGTAYHVMRVGSLPPPYYPPGDLTRGGRPQARRPASRRIAGKPWAGRAGDSLEAAVTDEELEETAKLFLLLRQDKTRFLTPEQVAEVRRRYPIK